MGDNTGEIQLGSETELLYNYINHYAVVTKASSNITLVQVYKKNGLVLINRSSGLQ